MSSNLDNVGNIGILNLNSEFSPFTRLNKFRKCKIIEVEVFSFPSGCEPHLKLIEDDITSPMDEIIITAKIKSTDDLFRLLFAADIIKHKKLATNLSIFISYLPFARQDRYTTPNDPFSLQTLADILNSISANRVFIFDPHSDVSTNIIKNSIPIRNHQFANKVLERFISIDNIRPEEVYIISPDKGAAAKIDDVMEYLHSQNHAINLKVSYCTKVRNPDTGKLSDPACDISDYNGADVLIIDDICDGGYTFIQLAKELRKRNVGKIALAVSHGIFSKGFEPFIGLIDKIYTTDSLWCESDDSEILNVIEIGSELETIDFNYSGVLS